MKTLVVLTPPAPPRGRPRRPPRDLPLGRAALTLAAAGQARVVFVSAPPTGRPGLRALGVVDDHHWQETDLPLDAVDGVYDRFPSQGDPSTWARLQDALGHVPWVNAPRAIALCRDKLAAQRALVEHGVAMPDVVEVDGGHLGAQRDWAGGYLKPRYGAFGAGVRRVDGREALPMRVAGLVPGVDEPALLQRAIASPALRLPDGRAARAASVRVLVQRAAADSWVAPVPVARVSLDREVVNVAAGAVACPLEDLVGSSGAPSSVVEATCAAAVHAARALEASLEIGDDLVELGVDVVLDASWRPWVIEVNGKPAGQLAAVARRDPARFGAAQREASLRPLRWLCGA